MSEQRKIIHDDNNGLDYVLVGDYYMPMLALPEENRPIGYWGILRKQYLKKHKSGMYGRHRKALFQETQNSRAKACKSFIRSLIRRFRIGIVRQPEL